MSEEGIGKEGQGPVATVKVQEEGKEVPKWVPALKDLSKYEHVVIVDDKDTLSTVFIGISTKPKSFSRVFVPWVDMLTVGERPGIVQDSGMRELLIRSYGG